MRAAGQSQNRNRLNRGILLAALFASLMAGASRAHAGEVEGRVLRVGLFAGSTPIIREGAWSFVEVELRHLGDAPFDGELRVDQIDRDGDVAVYTQDVALVPHGEWRAYQVYFVPQTINGKNEIRVKLFDRQGRQVKLMDDTGADIGDLPCPSVEPLPNDALLILDLTSPRKLAHIAALDSKRVGQYGRVNARCVRPLAPMELPSHWQGLSCADVIVWDNADPGANRSEQIEALIEWVKNGGRLLLSSGRNWQSLSGSPLAAALPVQLTGASQHREAQEFEALVANDNYERTLASRYLKHPITRCEMKPIEGAIPVPSECALPQLVWRRLLGRGTVTFVGASLADLLPMPKLSHRAEEEDEFGLDEVSKEDEFLTIGVKRVVAGRLLGLPQVHDEGDTTFVRPGALMHEGVDLFEVIRQIVSFESVGAVFLIFAVIFAAVYTLAATEGSRWYLRRRHWEQHSWTAFAIVSLLGSIMGTGMVWTLRGITTKLWQATVVDSYAGKEAAIATCLFGVKTPDHTRIDVRLPSGQQNSAAQGELGPLQVAPGPVASDNETRFVASDTYRSSLAGQRLDDVPVRATLKEFTGVWHGAMTGTVDGRIVIARNNGEDKDLIKIDMGDGSFIRNSLPFALDECRLLLTDEREELAGDGAVITTLCFDLGQPATIAAGANLDAEALRQRMFYSKKPDAPAGKPPERIERLPRLSKTLETLVRDMSGFGWNSDEMKIQPPRLTLNQENSALFMLSVFDLMGRDVSTKSPMHRSHARTLSCTHQLTKRTAILIGFSTAPPPATLEINRANLRPEKSRTIYRFVLPVERPRSEEVGN